MSTSERISELQDEALRDAVGLKALEEREGLTAPEIHFICDLNRHYLSQIFEELGEDIGVNFVNPYRIEYPRQTELTAENLKMFPAYIQNFQDLVRDFQPVAENVLEALENGQNVIGIFNHVTFANMPTAIALLEKNGVNLDDIITTLGPALRVSQKEWDVITSISNIHLTQPPTIRARLDEHNEEQGICTKKYANVFQQYFNSEQKKGSFFLFNPYGTRDKKQADGFYELPNVKKAQAFFAWLSRSTKTNPPLLVPIGINDEEVYTGRMPKQGNVYLRVGEFQDGNDGKFKGKEILEELASLIVDKDGNQIARLEEIKK